MCECAQHPDAFNPAVPILVPLGTRRQQEIDALSWIDYLNTPEWKAIRQFMLAAYPHSQLSGSIEGLEVHHVNWRPRGAERPRDLCVLTAPEHRREHDTTTPLSATEWLIDHEDDACWIAALKEYAARLNAKELAGTPRVRDLISKMHTEEQECRL